MRTTGAYGAVIGVFFEQKIYKQTVNNCRGRNHPRDFVHVKDVVRAFAAAITKISAKHLM